MAIFARNFAGSDLPPPAAISGDQGLKWRRLSGVETDPIRGVGCTGVWGDIMVVWNSKVKRVGGWSNPRMGDHPGKLLRELPETKPCGLVRYQSHSAVWCECADEDVGSLKGGGL
ncbi:hypothetical protein L3X38_044030 [Prunus dulcis]|uniref:Uncharacterized protein n=1 Tax=Prunus dulcis TaxID=3755 RepID=A0AAD4UZ69_PRUDU|nr:hypothetical protein L3X38_044030 [Prunus dulcis]